VTNILIQTVRSPEPLAGVRFIAQVDCDSLHTKTLSVRAFKASLFAAGGMFDVRPISMRVFGGVLDAELHARHTAVRGTGPGIQRGVLHPLWDCQLRCSLPGFRIEQFLASQSTQKAVSGTMDFSARLAMQGNRKSEFVQTAAGEMSLRGKDLTLEGSDLDRQLSRFESTQNFNLIDAGAVFFTGPLGLAVTKGYNFGSLFLGAGEKSTITRVVSEWKVEHGVAQAKDVAMATPKNRLALQGGLDFANERFADVTVAVLDEKGCAKGKQAIRGSFAKPEVEKPHLVKALTGSVVNELKRVRNVLPNGPCEPFYAGSVVAPR
jgi:AsmA protein